MSEETMPGDTPQKTVLVLGSTGSIGTNTLEVLRGLPGRFRVVGLSACGRWKELAEQVLEFGPAAVALADETHRTRFEKALEEVGVEILFGADGVGQLIDRTNPDVVVGAITGWAGFVPALKALQKGCVLALANKETLVVGGELVQKELDAGRGRLLPIDSEQSAIFQAMRSGRAEEVKRVIVTASGGPFHGLPREQLDNVTPEEALQHPNWEMGKKITIDSATMMNKALEVIETRWLFGLDADQIDVVIHPQSIIHSMVEFVDGSVVAQMGVPDMKLPIQYALTYPDRVCGPAERMDLARVGTLELHEADPGEYPALALGYEVARMGGTSGAVLNAANEVAVELFLTGAIGFTDIVPLVAGVLDQHEVTHTPVLATLEEADRWAREEAYRCSVR